MMAIQKIVATVLSTAVCVAFAVVEPKILTPPVKDSRVPVSSAAISESSAVPSSSIPVSSAVSSAVVSSAKPASSSTDSEDKPRVSTWEERQAVISKLNSFNFKAESSRNMYYNGLTYSDMLRNINSYIGAKVEFHGSVESLKRDQVTSTGLLVCGNPNYDENFVISFSYDGYPNFINSDSVFLYGVITGTSTYHTGDGESHETFNLDAYFYDADVSTENQPLSVEEQKCYYGNYTVYDNGKFYPLKIDANTINGHPYQILDINRSPDSVYIQFEFTEWPEAYQGKVLNGIGDEGVDSVLIDLDGDIGTSIFAPSNNDVNHFNYGKGWNTKYGKPTWAIQKEQELQQEGALTN